jgi:hypothetical protein
MEMTTHTSTANDMLRTYVGASLNVAFYTESLRKIALRIYFGGFNEVLYLIGVGCQSINGQFYVPNVNLSIVKIDDNTEDSVTIISDCLSGFTVTTNGGFTLVKGNQSEFGSSFENFLRSDSIEIIDD